MLNGALRKGKESSAEPKGKDAICSIAAVALSESASALPTPWKARHCSQGSLDGVAGLVISTCFVLECLR